MFIGIHLWILAGVLAVLVITIGLIWGEVSIQWWLGGAAILCAIAGTALYAVGADYNSHEEVRSQLRADYDLDVTRVWWGDDGDGWVNFEFNEGGQHCRGRALTPDERRTWMVQNGSICDGFRPLSSRAQR